MKTLILVRHAQADRGEPTQADIDRPLSRRGYRDAQTVSKKFAQTGILPDLILSGSAPRALKTARIFAQKLGLSPDAVQINRRIYEAERAEMLGLVRAFDDQYSTMMLVGHNPGISGLLHHLTDSSIHILPNCSVAVVELPVASWRDIAFKVGRLEYAVCPKGEEQQMHSDEPDPGIWERFSLWLTPRSRRVKLFFNILIGLTVLVIILILFLGRADGAGRLPGGAHFRHIEKHDDLPPFKPVPFKDTIL
jgi:phosphohistidine phosphatase